jgi:hypothetical protein
MNVLPEVVLKLQEVFHGVLVIGVDGTDDRGGNATLALHYEPAGRGLVDAQLTGQVSRSLGKS